MQYVTACSERAFQSTIDRGQKEHLMTGVSVWRFQKSVMNVGQLVGDLVHREQWRIFSSGMKTGTTETS